jgi:serine phosphatase RsbU (regulator of sigma subunit)
MLTRFFLGFALLLSICASAQEPVTDSLLRVANKTPQDTTTISAYLALSQEAINSGYEQSLDYARKGLAVAEQLDDKVWQGRCYYHLGNTSFSFGFAKEAEGYFTTAIALLREDKGRASRYWLAKSMNGLGNAQRRLGRLKEATDSYLGAKEIYEALGDKKGIAGAYNNLGIIFMAEGQQEKALEYLRIASRMNIEINNRAWLAKNVSNMGNAFYNLQMFDSAEVYFKEGIRMSEEMGDRTGWASDVMNLGNVYTSQKNYSGAASQFNTALSFYRESGRESDMAFVMYNLAGLYTTTGAFDRAKIYLDSSAEISARYGDLGHLIEIYKGYAAMYEGTGDFKNAYRYYTRYATLRDSIMSTDMKNQMDQMEESLREGKLKEQNAALIQSKVLQDVKLDRSNIIIASAAGGIFLLLLLAVVIFKRYQLKKKANDLLKERHVEIQAQKAIIEQKNLDISDSINYAKKIQETILPDLAALESAYNDSFVLYRPRNVVSGDFYWYSISGKKNFIAVADCTGHGVPGAFMSMIGIDKINNAVVESAMERPADVLSAVNRLLKIALRQDDHSGGMRDGMDVALISIDHDQMKLEYAGANRPVWIIRNSELIELIPSKVSIGGHTAAAYAFTSQEFDLQKNDCIYLFTDGYSDQFGGPKGKKMMTKKFKQTLLSVSHETMQAQKDYLSAHFDAWKGDLEQVDDVCVIGLRA